MSTEKIDFEYYAFISYSRRDLADAKWFHKGLEKFHIPSKLPKTNDEEKLPKRLKLFRDKTDLDVNSDSFKDNIKRALAASKYLIVLCSPNAAKSTIDGTHYINWEIEEFINAHGKDYSLTHILPVVLSGQINSGNSETECMPPNLLSLGTEFLEHNFPVFDKSTDAMEIKNNKNEFILKTISFLLNVKYSVLNDRFLKEQRKKLRRFLCLAAFVVALLTTLTVWAIVERQNTKKTLAQSDFNEASNLLEQNQTSTALAYFDSSLNEYSNLESSTLLYNTIIKKSWLIEKEWKESSVKHTQHNWIEYGNFSLYLETYKKDSTYDIQASKDFSTVQLFNIENKTIAVDMKLKEGFEWKSFMLDEKEEYLLCSQTFTNFSNNIYLENEDRASYLIRVYSVSSGKVVNEYSGNGILLSGSLISQDGYHIAYCINNGLSNRYDLVIKSTDGLSKDWICHLSDFKKMIFSPDGTILVVNSEVEEPGRITVFDVYTGKEPLYTESLASPIQNWSFSNDGRRVAFVTIEKEIGVFNIRDGKECVERRVLDVDVSSISFADDDKSLLISTSNNIRCFGIQISPLRNRSIRPKSGYIILDGFMDNEQRILATIQQNSDKSLIQVDDLYANNEQENDEKGKEIVSNIKHLERIPNVGTFSPDCGFVVLGYGDVVKDSENGCIEIISTNNQPSNANNWKMTKKIDVPMAISFLKFSPDGKKFLAYSQSTKINSVLVISLLDNSCTPIESSDEKSWILDAEFTFSGRVVTFSSDKIVRQWNATTGICDWSCDISKETNETAGSCMAISTKGVIACGTKILNSSSSGGRIIFINSNGKVIKTKENLPGGIKQLVFTKDGMALGVAYTSGNAQVFDVKTGAIRSRALRQGISDGSTIQEIDFLESGNDIMILTVCGENSNKSGFSEVWNFKLSKKLDSTLVTDSKVKEIIATNNGDLLAITAAEVTIASYTESFTDSLNLKKDAALLGGWKLNQFRVPESYYNTNEYQQNITNPKSEIMEWLSNDTLSRKKSPNNTQEMKKYLDILVNSDLEYVLDICPNYELALGEYWFDKTMDLVEKHFMDEVNQNDSQAVFNREMQWSSIMSSGLYWNYFNKDVEAVRYANFLTQDYIKKYPESSKAWYNRANYESRIYEMEQAKTSIENALKYDSGNIDAIRFKAALTINDSERLSVLEQGKTGIENKEKNTISKLCQFSKDYIICYSNIYGTNNISIQLDWVLAQLKKHKPSMFSFADQYSIVYTLCGTICQHLQYLPEGAKSLLPFCSQILTLFESDNSVSSDMKDSLQFTTAYLEMIVGNLQTAKKYYVDVITKESPYSFIAMQNLSYIYSFEGLDNEALQLVQQVLQYDRKNEYELSKSMINDLTIFRMLGNPVPFESKVKPVLLQLCQRHVTFGPVINSVLKDGQAKKVGIRIGDKLISYNGYPIFADSFSSILQLGTFSSNKDLKKLVVERDGKELVFSVHPGKLGISF